MCIRDSTKGVLCQLSYMGATVIDQSRADIGRSIRWRSHALLAQTTSGVRERSQALVAQAVERSHALLTQAVERSHAHLTQATRDSSRTPTLRYSGAGNGIRTRDPQLGRLALYR